MDLVVQGSGNLLNLVGMFDGARLAVRRAMTSREDVTRPDQDRSRFVRACAPAAVIVLTVLTALLGACGGNDGAALGSTRQSTVGSCVREPEMLGGPDVACVTDLECPCGSYCDGALGLCTYACMPPDIDIPPGGFAGLDEACAANAACDDTGRCIGVGSGPPGTAVVLGAVPAVVTTVAGGPARTFDVTLRLTNPSQADLAQSEQTVVRVVARDGAQVSCDGTTYGDACEHTAWEFSLHGVNLVATRPVEVRTVAGTPDDHGDVKLFIDTTQAQFVVSALAGPAVAEQDGLYTGAIVGPDGRDRLPVTARVHNQLVLVDEPSRSLAPDGALVLDLHAGSIVARRRMVWLRGLGATEAAGAIVGSYAAGAAIIDPAAGTIELPLDFQVPGVDGLTGWQVELTRAGATTVECTADTACATGEVCVAALGACVPAAVWTPTTAAESNLLDDARSAAWWAAAQPAMTTTAFAASGPDLVESIECATNAAAPAKLGVTQVKLDGTESRSGDLGCVDGTGVPVASSGPVGVATLADRGPAAAAVASTALATCMAELAQVPPTGSPSFATLFGPTVGACVNLARVVPALRLLTGDELGRGTGSVWEPRNRGLLVRLVQQWTNLHGLVASTGLSQAAYQDIALAPIPPAELRTTLLGLLDVIDRGWGALLDRRIQPAIRNAVRWSPIEDGDQSRDYRLIKRPIVYWTFDGYTTTPHLDLVRQLPLVLQAPTTTHVCKINNDVRAFGQGFNCPGYMATLPPDAPSLLADASLGGADRADNLTITMNVDARNFGTNATSAMATPPASARAGGPQLHCPPEGCELPDPEDPPSDPPHPPHLLPVPYRGGTLIATPTLAIGDNVDAATGFHSLVLAHPTATGVELTTFNLAPRFGWTPPAGEGDSAQGTTFAIVRDAAARRYTLYVHTPGPWGSLWETSLYYTQDPVGTLDWVPDRTIRLGAAGTLPAGHYWTAYQKSYGGFLDDVAVFDSALSAAEVDRFSTERGTVDSMRTVWPANMVLTSQGTEDIGAPLGAQILETLAGELQITARLAAAIEDRAQVACNDPTGTGIAARADVAAVVTRIGRTLRQSRLVESLATFDVSDRAQAARQLVGVRRSEIQRMLQPARCVAAFGMGEDEVPLYFNSITPTASETTAFFAASDHLLGLASDRVAVATGSLAEARSAYVQARQSEIQQLESDTARQIRIDAIETQYGDTLRRVCGLTGASNGSIADRVMTPDPEAPFAIGTCFVEPTPYCRAQLDGTLADADASCFRGTLGANAMDLKAAYFAAESANQSWIAAVDNAKAAEKLCVDKQVEIYGPAGSLATLQAFTDYVEGINEERMIRSKLMAWASIMPQVIAMNNGAGSGVPILNDLVTWLLPDLDFEVAHRKLLYETLQAQVAAHDAIRQCWMNAEQYERAIGAAENTSKQSLARYQSAAIGLANAHADGEQALIELRIALTRELTQPSIPIAFHYWLDEKIATYQRQFATARRYSYLALRAVEYDKQESYVATVAGKPVRAAVIGAAHPAVLSAQLDLMLAQTATRRINGQLPSLQHVTFDLGAKFFGLSIGSPLLGHQFAAHLRPVYDTAGHYMGEGFRFSFVPRADEAPADRCAERIWRVAVGGVGFPTNDPSNMRLKLFKRSSFASHQCGTDELRTATWRPEANLLAGAGEPASYEPGPAYTAADVGFERLDVAGALDAFRESDTAYNGSSTELSLQGLYGDYVLLLPQIALDHGLVANALTDLNLRFDFLSGDNSGQPLGFAIQSDSGDGNGPLVVE